MAVRAKFKCMSKQPNDYEIEGNAPGTVGHVRLAPSYEYKEGVEGNAVEENKVFGKYTPCGELTMTIHNPAAFAQFEEGQQYYIDITPAEA